MTKSGFSLCTSAVAIKLIPWWIFYSTVCFYDIWTKYSWTEIVHIYKNQCEARVERELDETVKAEEIMLFQNYTVVIYYFQV